MSLYFMVIKILHTEVYMHILKLVAELQMLPATSIATNIIICQKAILKLLSKNVSFSMSYFKFLLAGITIYNINFIY